MHIHIHTYINTYIQDEYIYIYTYMYTFIYIYVCVYMYMYMYIDIDRKEGFPISFHSGQGLPCQERPCLTGKGGKGRICIDTQIHR